MARGEASRTNVNRSTIVPSKIDLAPRPGATYVLEDTRLRPGSVYQYRVTATQAHKRRPIELVSAVRSITTKPLELPAAPSNLEVAGTTTSTISVTWKDNADNESGFTYSYRVRGANSGGRRNIASPNRTSVDVIQLRSGTEYEIRVSSRNGDGVSEFSAPVFADEGF